jgi:hypothetical protein
MPIRLLGDAVLRRRAWDLADQLGWASTYDAEYVALTQLQADRCPRQESNLRTRFRTPAEDKFVSNYLFTRLALSIAEGVTAELPVNRDAVGLALSELKQDHGDLAGAIDVVEQLEPTTYSAVSLAELYAENGRWDDVIELTEGITNADDASALLCVFRGQAFREQGFHDAAHEALKEALRSRSRPAEIRHLALSERAANYLVQGEERDGAQGPRTHPRRGFEL